MTYQPSGDMPDPYRPEHLYGQQPSSARPNPPQPDLYVRPGYDGQPGSYGAPGSYARPGPAARTNTLAILALVFAFLFAPAAIVLGRKAKRQIRRTGERGESLASAGLMLGYLFTALFLFGCLLLVIGALLSGSRDIS